MLGRVITLNRARDVLLDGAVAIAGGDIVAVGPREEVLRSNQARQTIGGPRAIVLPGMIDTHTHCTQCFVRALTANELPMIPRVYVPAQRSLSPAQAHATVRLIAAQLIRAGVTTLCDGTVIGGARGGHPRGPRRGGDPGVRGPRRPRPGLHARRAVQPALRAVLGHAATGRGGGGAHAHGGVSRALPGPWPGLIRGAVNVSALPSFSETYFRLAAALAREHDATLQVHVARDREEVEFALSVWGRRPIERLADMGVIDPHLVAVHAVLASGPEIDLLAKGGAALTHSPMECVYNLNAIPDVQRLPERGDPRRPRLRQPGQ